METSTIMVIEEEEEEADRILLSTNILKDPKNKSKSLANYVERMAILPGIATTGSIIISNLINTTCNHPTLNPQATRDPRDLCLR